MKKAGSMLSNVGKLNPMTIVQNTAGTVANSALESA